MRVAIQNKDWRIDGESKPARAPTSYIELAKAVGLLLEEKADIYATSQTGMDMMFNIDGSVRKGPKLTQPNSPKEPKKDGEG
eukprot:11290856-Karenia_brevis.AAC.1